MILTLNYATNLKKPSKPASTKMKDKLESVRAARLALPYGNT